MILAGSMLALAAVSGRPPCCRPVCVTPLAFFHSRHFITMAQGISMPYAQVGAMAEIPRFAGTAAGIGVFMQNFGAAVFSQLYGLFADGTPQPMMRDRRCCAGCSTPMADAERIPMLQKPDFGSRRPPPGILHSLPA